MGTYSPRPVSANSPTPDPDELLWGRVAGFLDDPRTSKAFRNQLVNIVATLPNSTVSREGSSVIVRHTVKQDGVTFTDTLTFDAATLDLLTHDSHPSSRTGTIKGVTYPHVVITYQPVEITSHRP